jgi:hypothetical protein
MIDQTSIAAFYDDFCEAASLNKSHSPYKRRSEDGTVFGWFEIIGCSHKAYWYAPYIGAQFLGKFRYRTFPGLPVPPELFEVVVTRRVGRVWEISGRCVKIEDVTLL